MATAVGDRLTQIKAHFRLSNRKLAQIAGITGQGVADILKGVSKNPRNHIFVRLAEKLDVNIDWLLTGEGEMLKKNTDVEEVLPTYHTTTRLSYVRMGTVSTWEVLSGKVASENSYFVSTEMADRYKHPCVLQVRGDNMEPELKHEDILLITEVPASEWVMMPSGLYVIAYKPEHVTIARLIENTLMESTRLVLHSDNPKYGKVTLALEQIAGVWQVRRLIDRDMY